MNVEAGRKKRTETIPEATEVRHLDCTSICWRADDFDEYVVHGINLPRSTNRRIRMAAENGEK